MLSKGLSPDLPFVSILRPILSTIFSQNERNENKYRLQAKCDSYSSGG